MDPLVGGLSRDGVLAHHFGVLSYHTDQRVTLHEILLERPRVHPATYHRDCCRLYALALTHEREVPRQVYTPGRVYTGLHIQCGGWLMGSID